MKKLILFLSWSIIANSVSAQNETNLKGLETLAKQGDLAAQIELANAYRKGIGVTQDYKTAVKWFTLAAEQGDARGRVRAAVGARSVEGHADSPGRAALPATSA